MKRKKESESQIDHVPLWRDVTREKWENKEKVNLHVAISHLNGSREKRLNSLTSGDDNPWEGEKKRSSIPGVRKGEVPCKLDRRVAKALLLESKTKKERRGKLGELARTFIILFHSSGHTERHGGVPKKGKNRTPGCRKLFLWGIRGV